MPQEKIPSELFLPFLEENSSTSQYRRLFKAFQYAILNGHLSSGSRLPATRPLCRELGVSRNSVKTAYEMLQAEGYTETRHGAGTFVSSSLPDQQPSNPKAGKKVTDGNFDLHISRLAKRLNQTKINSGSDQASLLSPAMPCVKSFPWAQWQRHVAQASRSIKDRRTESVMGYEPLRQQIASYLQIVRGVHCSAGEIMVCSGSQQAIYLAFQMLVDHGEDVLIEDPGYYGISGALTAAGANGVAVPADSQGFQLDVGLRLSTNAKIALLTPSRNYPMGYTLSLERRISLLNWVKQTGGWLIEDDYDSEFRFDGPPLTALQGLGGADNTLYVGTFSRILHPSIRLGYLVLPPALIDTFRRARRFMDGGLSLIPQAALAGFMASGEFSSHVRRMRKLYQHRRSELFLQVNERFDGLLERVDSDGGMHSVFLLPEGYPDTTISSAARKAGIAIRPLSDFYENNAGPSGLVVGFAGNDSAETSDALEILFGIIRAYSKQNS